MESIAVSTTAPTPVLNRLTMLDVRTKNKISVPERKHLQ